MNSSTSVEILKPEENSDIIQKSKVLIPSSLHALLAKVKKIQQVSSFDQVLDAMKEYIFTQKLFDPKNPTLVYCQNDELGTVLGVQNFTLWDIKKLLLQKLSSQNFAKCSDTQPSPSSSGSEKRKDIDDVLDLSNMTKKPCLIRSPSPMFLFIPLSPKYDSSSETNLSVQNYETSFVKDSSDEYWFSEESDHDEKILAFEQMYEVEYEVESLSSGGSIVSDTDSEIEDIVQAAITSVICKTDSDMEFWADDSSEEDFGSDNEITGSDKWKCEKCGSYNKPPMRYCQKCWDQRVGWLPDRKERRQPPRHKSKATKKDHITTEQQHCFDKNIQENPVCRTDDFKSKTIPGSSQESLSTEASQDLCKDLCEKITTQSQELCNIQPPLETFLSSGHEYCNSESPNVTNSKQCIICCEKPKNATIVHGKIGHQLSCYRCARKLLSQNKPCPWCRRPIDRVVHQIFVV